MKHDLKPYCDYKESGLPWIGKMPTHWKFHRLDRLFSLRKENPLPNDQRVTGYLNGRVTLRSNVQGQKIKGVIKEAGWQRVYPGDFAISGMNAHLGGMGVSDSLGKCSPIYLILKPNLGTNTHFIAHSVRHMASMGALKSIVNTIRFNSADLKRDDLKQIRVWVPPQDEQSAIVRYLDHVDWRIHKYIRVKKKQIALLNEQKQAIIQRAVTRGLGPNVRLKPSGAEWMGNVPEHWDVTRCKFVFREIDERSRNGQETHLSMSQKFGLVPNEQIEERRLVSESYIGAKLCKVEDLILNRLKAHLGVFAVAKQDGLVSPDYTVFRAINPINLRFFEFLFRTPACRVELRKRAKGIVEGFWRLYTDDFYDIKIAFPKIKEQNAIIDFLDSSLKNLNSAIDVIYTEISLIQEYRMCLISDVITGKLDVREVVASLPGEMDKPIEVDNDELLFDDSIAEELDDIESEA